MAVAIALAMVLSAISLLEVDGAVEHQRRRFEAIASATDQMQRLVEDLLLLARQDENPLADPQLIDLERLVQQQLDLYSDAVALRQQRLTGDLEGGLTVRGQVKLIQQLVRNLLDNAHRHSPEGASIAVRLWSRGRLACLEVSDSGPGIPCEQLPRVFDRFWRASPDRSEGGSGLGLAIASRICRLHGGAIRVSSTPGSGSRFLVELPLAA